MLLHVEVVPNACMLVFVGYAMYPGIKKERVSSSDFLMHRLRVFCWGGRLQTSMDGIVDVRFGILKIAFKVVGAKTVILNHLNGQ